MSEFSENPQKGDAHRSKTLFLSPFPPFFFFFFFFPFFFFFSFFFPLLPSFCYAASTHDTTPSACFPRDFRFPPQLRLSYPIYRAILRIYPRILKGTRGTRRARAKVLSATKFPPGFLEAHASPSQTGRSSSTTYYALIADLSSSTVSEDYRSPPQTRLTDLEEQSSFRSSSIRRCI